jgi:hypothetical protein
MKRLAVLAAVVGLWGGALTGTGRARADLITNGGFETGDFTGWTLTNTFPSSTSVNTATNNAQHYSPHSGTYFADLGNIGSLGTLSQTISDTLGQSYTLSMYLENSRDNDTPNEFKVEWNGSVLFDQTNMGATNGYELLSFTVQGTGSDTLVLSERNDPFDFALDDVSLNSATTATPEPASLTLVGIGAAGLLGYGWRRKRAA